LIILSVICLLLTLILILVIHDISRITKDLDYINQNDTNGNVTTSTSFFIVKNLSQTINSTLKKKYQLQEKQESQNKQFNKMLTNLTHDIKTPLTVSMGYVQLLAKKNTYENQQELLRVNENLKSVNYYLHYLMDFNLLQEKSKNLKFTKFNLSDTLQKELFTYYDQLTSNRIHAQIDITPKVIVKSDEMMFIRIFQNLIGNILKYSTNSMAVSLSSNDKVIQITFQNQTNEDLHDSDQLLNRFYTADISRNNQSVGLGLSIVQSLVTALGGKAKLNTDTNSFQITLTFKNLQIS